MAHLKIYQAARQVLATKRLNCSFYPFTKSSAADNAAAWSLVRIKLETWIKPQVEALQPSQE